MDEIEITFATVSVATRQVEEGGGCEFGALHDRELPPSLSLSLGRRWFGREGFRELWRHFR